MSKTVFLVVILFSFLSAQARVADFTKANSAFSKSYVDQGMNERLSDKKNARFSTDKEFSTARFVSSKDASRFMNMSPNFGEADNARVMQGMKNYYDGKNYNRTPNSPFKDTDRWYKENNQVGFRNLDRDLNKKYLGKIEVDRRYHLNDKMRAKYNDHFERSMSDINKFHFRSSHSTDAGITVSKAGGELEKDDSSIFDFLDSNQKIESGKPKLVLPKAMVTDPAKLERLSGNNIPYNTPAQSTSSTVQTPSSVNNVYQTPVRNTSNTVVEETVDTSEMNFTSLGVPKEMQGGKTTIKVKVKN